MKIQDCFIKLSDPTKKARVTVTQHRAWDKERFISAMKKRYETDAKPEDVRMVSSISHAEYQQLRI